MSSSSQIVKRKYIRAAPDPNEYVQIDRSLDGEFSFQYAGLVVEESPLSGCSIVCLQSVGLKAGDHCRLKVGSMSPLKSKVIWESKLDNRVSRYGFQFLE